MTRTTVWNDPNEPAIVSIGRFSPDHFRPVGAAENIPNPDSMNSDAHPDFREYRLGAGSADRRPFVYFMSASYFFITASMMRSFLCKWVHFWWVSRVSLSLLFFFSSSLLLLSAAEEGSGWSASLVSKELRSSEWRGSSRSSRGSRVQCGIHRPAICPPPSPCVNEKTRQDSGSNRLASRPIRRHA